MGNKTLITPIFRVAFPHIFKPQDPMKGSAATAVAKFGLTAIFSPATFTPEDKIRWAEMKAQADATSMEAFKKPLSKLPSTFKIPFRDGAEKDLNGFGEGTIFISFTSRQRPGLVASDRVTPIEDPEDFYPGCYARVSYRPYSYDNTGKGVALGLQNVIKIKDGDRLDSRTQADQDFKDLGETDVMDDVL